MQIVFFSRVTLFVDMSQPFQDLHFHCLLLKWSENWVKIAQSCPALCNPMDCIVHGILQARILEWAAFPFPRVSFQPRDRTQVSCIADILYQLSHKRSPCHLSVAPFFPPPSLVFFFFFGLYLFFLEISSLAYLLQVPVKYEHHAWTFLIHLLYCLEWQWLLYQCIKLQV